MSFSNVIIDTSFFNRTLALIYLALSLGWLVLGSSIFFTTDAVPRTPYGALLGVLLVGSAILLFSFIHWKVSNNALGILREKCLVAFSSIVAVLLIITALSFYKYSSAECLYSCESLGYSIAILIFFLISSSFLTLIFGVASLFKIRKGGQVPFTNVRNR